MVRAILSLFILQGLLAAPASAGFRATAFAYPVFGILLVSPDPTVGRAAPGWGGGAALEWGPTRWLGLELGAHYTRRVVSGPLASQSSFTYAQIPFLIRFWPWKYVNLGVGGYLGYALDSVSTSVAGSASQLSYSALGYNRWDWGAAGAIGFQIPLMRYWFVFIDGRMMYGFHNIEENPVGDSKSSWLEFSAVAGFRVGNF